ncbi:unnamed protein product [Darwinula stevensoni]|uniref:Glycosyltransferase family 92 protein n=1 Tax=Darwinula stevensoni TaxID=69355 RepID=A0A7R9A5C1_9CRUS|nr:unnamed protein product [Darwinula stevensoni]CAG0894087.1 unnamed protein product [Darwinula stevensoni]
MPRKRGRVLFMVICFGVTSTVLLSPMWTINQPPQLLPRKKKEILSTTKPIVERNPSRRFRNIPLELLRMCEIGSKQPGIYPCYDNIRFNNLYYQHLRLRKENIDIYLYSAFHDHRKEKKIRIFGMIIGPEESVPILKCKFYQRNQTYGFREGHYTELYQNIQQNWPVPFTLSCELMEGEPIPDAVSVLPSDSEEVFNILKVFQRDRNTLSEESHAVSLCVKQLYFVQDLSYLLTEWLEILKSMEVGKVFAYGLQPHPNMERVLEHYEDQGGFVDYIPITLPGTQPNIPGPNGQFLPRNADFHRGFYHLQLNDCLYRSLVQGYEYVAVIDVDEMIVPDAPYMTWPKLMQHLVSENPRYDCYYFLTRIILMEEGETTGWLQDHDVKLRHVNAAEFNALPNRVGKSICVTNQQETMSNHYSEMCFPGYRMCYTYHTPRNFGELYHYGKCSVRDCAGSGGNGTCDGQSCEVVRKTALLAHGDSVRQGVLHTLQQLQLLPFS